MIRKSIHSIQDTFNILQPALFEKRKTRVNFFGDKVKANSQRYQLFYTKGMKCVCCGIEGKFFAKEKKSKNDGSYHLNLYGINSNGKEVLMTKDHILPKSLGGKDCLENYQCMCVTCNVAKGNNVDFLKK